MSHRLSIGLVAAGLAAAAIVPSVALASTGSPAPARTGAHQRFAMPSVTVGTHDRPARVIAAGPIQGRGTVAEKVVKQTSTGAVLLTTFTFANGSVRLRVNDSDTMKVDLHSCTATGLGKGTWRIVSGTGAYRNATGSGTFVRRTFIVGAFDSHAQCLGRSATPTAVTGNVVADGTATS
jgi:hypothetical protein